MKVHFLGFSKSQDEWIGAASGNPSGKLVPHGEETPDVFKVERILRKRRRGLGFEYFCRWEGYGAEEDSWEQADNVADDLIEDFETVDVLEDGTGAQPYVLSRAFPLDDPMADDLAAEWVDGVGRKGAALLGHQRDEWAAKRFFSMTPCPAWLYVALHRAFCKRAGERHPLIRATLVCRSSMP